MIKNCGVHTVHHVAMNCLKHDESGSQHCAVEELDLHRVTV